MTVEGGVCTPAVGVDSAWGVVAEAFWQAEVRTRHPINKKSLFIGSPIKRIRPAV
jgi:hypothetical protein